MLFVLSRFSWRLKRIMVRKGAVESPLLFIQLQSLKFLENLCVEQILPFLDFNYLLLASLSSTCGHFFELNSPVTAHLLFQELDWESIAAGLLHDTVEDTNVVTFERIEEDFGPTVRHIVEGETKVAPFN